MVNMFFVTLCAWFDNTYDLTFAHCVTAWNHETDHPETAYLYASKKHYRIDKAKFEKLCSMFSIDNNPYECEYGIIYSGKLEL